MYDITPAFIAAKRDSSKWDNDAFHRALELISDRCLNITIDSSDVDDSGKKWAQIYGGAVKDGNSEHFGIMWSDGPLCFLSPYIAKCVGSELRRNGLVVVKVNDFNDQHYRINSSLSEYLFGIAWNKSYLDPDRLSILDLEWMTV